MASPTKLFNFRGQVRSSPTNDSRLLNYAIEVLIAVLVFTVYWTTRAHYNTFDAVSYANQIENLYPKTHNVKWLFHPHHLLFNVTGFWVWKLCSIFRANITALAVLESINVVVTVAGMLAFYRLLKVHIERTVWIPVLVTLGVAFSFGTWICGTDGRVNAPSNFFLILAAYWMFRALQIDSRKELGFAGLFAGLAVLYHESAGLFLGVGLLAAWYSSVQLRAQGSKLTSAARSCAAFVVPWFAVIFLAYAIATVWCLRLHSLSAIHQWLQSYSELGWWWNFDILHNIRLDAYALRHAAFVEPPGKQGTFHLSPQVPQGLEILYFAVLAGWFIGLYTFCTALPILSKTHYARTLWLCLLWIGVYTAFFTIWSPGYFVFWVPVLFPVAILLALVLSHYRGRQWGRTVNYVISVWVAMLFCVNLITSIGPHSAADSDPYRRIASEVASHTRPNDLVIVAGAGDLAQCEVDIPYFAKRTCISVHSALTTDKNDTAVFLRTASDDIASSMRLGNSVYVFDDVVYGGKTLLALQARHPTLKRSDIDLLMAPYKLVPAWKGQHGVVLRLTARTINITASPDTVSIDPKNGPVTNPTDH